MAATIVDSRGDADRVNVALPTAWVQIELEPLVHLLRVEETNLDSLIRPRATGLPDATGEPEPEW
jgi:hypothetical protein